MEYVLPTAHRATTTMLNESGHPFMPPARCKDYVHDALTHHFYPRYAALWHITDYKKTAPNINRPTFVVYCGVKSVEKNAKKFVGFINQVESMMGIEDKSITTVSKTGASQNSAPMISIASNFWIRSPIGVSAYLTFLRLTPYMRLGESFDSFIKRQMDSEQCKNINSAYLRIADKNGNLKGLLERSLPCLNREGYSDYLLSCHSRGFSVYNRQSDTENPMEEQALVALRIKGRKAEMERLHAYPYKMNA